MKRKLQNSLARGNLPCEPFCLSADEANSSDYLLGDRLAAASESRETGSKSWIFLAKGVLQLSLMGLFFLFAFPLFAKAGSIQKPDEITFEWLIDQGKETGYSDHIPHFRKLFDSAEIGAFLEFGVGYSTKYFLDRCREVVSVEFVVDGAGPAFMKEMMRLYQGIDRWIPYVFFSGTEEKPDWAPFQYVGSNAVSNAAFIQCSTHKTNAWVDATYLQELGDFILSLTDGYRIDAAFVDPGIYLRGDLVQLLFDKVPIIAAHDSNDRFFKIADDPYGYFRIETPPNYEEIHIVRGQGTTFWILKDEAHTHLIEEMRTYAMD